MTKNRILLIGAAMLALAAFPSFGQSNGNNAPATMPPLPSAADQAAILANVPTVPLANETFGLSIGTMALGASSVKQVTILDYSPSKNFFVGAELVNSASSGTVLESAGLRAGIYKAATTARFYGYLEGRRNWSSGLWEGKAGAGIAYTPFQSQTNSLLQNFSAVADFGFVVNNFKSGKSGAPPPEEETLGVRYSF